MLGYKGTAGERLSGVADPLPNRYAYRGYAQVGVVMYVRWASPF